MCSNRCPTTRSDVLKRFHLINCCSLFDKNTFDNSSGVVVDEIWLSLVVGEVTVDWMVACCSCCCCCCLIVARRIFSTCTFCIASLALRTFHGGVVFPSRCGVCSWFGISRNNCRWHEIIPVVRTLITHRIRAWRLRRGSVFLLFWWLVFLLFARDEADDAEGLFLPFPSLPVVVCRCLGAANKGKPVFFC